MVFPGCRDSRQTDGHGPSKSTCSTKIKSLYQIDLSIVLSIKNENTNYKLVLSFIHSNSTEGDVFTVFRKPESHNMCQ